MKNVVFNLPLMEILNLQSVEEMASGAGFKMTPQRRVIIKFLEKATNHPSADDVFFAVNQEFPMTSRATVYNTLNWLKSVGMLKERFEGDRVLYDPNCAEHHHFVCNQCGAVEDVGFDQLSDIGPINLGGISKVDSYEVTVRGICTDCS